MPSEDQVEFLSVRGLSNYAYCPRLFYLQRVEGVFVPNADTAAGTSAHRQVDKPSRLQEWGEDFVLPQGARLRSLQLSSERLGLSGEIDLLEGSAEGALILDYKKGAARRAEDGSLFPKDNDALQVAAYALLAREDGLIIAGASIYYAADRKRVTVPLSDELLARVGEAAAAARILAENGVCPPPLENDPRCHYCSAYSVCLPGESKYWAASPGEKPPKELEPPLADRDEGEVLVVQEPRAFVGKHGDEVRVTLEKKDAVKLPLHQLRAIYLYGAVQISSQLVQTCLEECIDVAYFASSGRFLGLLRGLPASGVDARLGQYRLFCDPQVKLKLAKEIVRGKIHNQRVLLMRNGNASDTLLGRLKDLRERTADASSELELLGMEGEAASIYFSQFATMIKNSSFDFTHRNRRPPRDPANALLSLGYGVLAKELAGVCHSVGLDAFLGFYHHPRYGRPALALDLMEEFRPLVVDSLAISLLNRGELQPDADFIRSTQGCNLNEQGRRVFWQGWFRRLDTEVSHPVFSYRMSYRRMFEIQARQLWRFVRGDASSYTAFTTR